MAASEGFLDLVRELLAPAGHITIKRMFSGASIYADGVIFALVEDDVLYLKADDTTKGRYEAEGLGPFTYEGKTRPVSMSYWRAPERLYDEPDEMLVWAREAVKVAASQASAKADKAKRAARSPEVKTKTSPTPRSKKKGAHR